MHVSSLALLLVAACEAAPPAPEAPMLSPPVAEAPITASVPEELPDVAERAVQSAVNISTTRLVTAPQSPFHSDPFFFFFPPGHEGGPQMPQERRQGSLGSGVIVDANGVILTNHHVVGGAESIEVTLHDGRTFEAEVVGTDPRSDVGVVKIVDPPDDLVPLPFGDSEDLRLGEPVLAIGNPFGVGQTVTFGIVSAKGRANLGITDYEDFIQTDAAINPGNSGGGLVNLRGELVGINTAIFSRTGGYQGIGFAIPSSMAQQLMLDLLDDGTVDRGFLGVMIQDLDRELAEAMGVDAEGGAVVADVNPGSPAARAGFQRGDVVVQFDGEPVDSATDFRMAVANAGADSDFTAEVVRDGKRKKLKGTLGALDGEEQARGDEPEQGDVLGGVSLAPLDARARAMLRIPDEVRSGVVVQSVAPGSAAARVGLSPGDVILEVDEQPVASVEDVRQAIPRQGPVLLLVTRQGATRYVVIKQPGS